MATNTSKWGKILTLYKRLTDEKFATKYRAQHRKSFFRYRSRLWSYRFRLVGHVALQFLRKLPGFSWLEQHFAKLKPSEIISELSSVFVIIYQLVGVIWALLKRGFQRLRKWLANLINRIAEFFKFDYRIDISKFGYLNFEMPDYHRPVSTQSIFNTILGHDNVVVTSEWSKDREVTLPDGSHQRRAHKGTDLRTRGNVPVYSPFSGTVTAVHNSLDGDGGRYVIITTGNVSMFVCHLSKINVKLGDSVRPGQCIAISGRSGKGKENFYAPHLHVDFRKKINGAWVSVHPSVVADEAPRLVNSSMPFPNAIPLPRAATISSHDSDVINIAQYFINRGYSVNQAAAILGNLEQESNLNPTALNTKSGASGVCQWLGARKENYRKIYGSYPHIDGDLNHQIEFLYREINETWQKNLLKKHNFYSSDDLDVLTESFCVAFERPGKDEAKLGTRKQYAQMDKSIYLSGAKTKVLNQQSTSNTFNLVP